MSNPSNDHAAFVGPFVKLAAVPGVPDPPKILPFDRQEQEMSNWCWAATTASVETYYNKRAQKPGVDQRAIVAKYHPDLQPGDPLPAYNDMSGDFNQPESLQGPLEDISHLNDVPLENSVGFDVVVGQIDGNNPICCRFATAVGHYVVIVGYQKGVEDVYIVDPDRSPKYCGARTHASLTTGDNPIWDETFFTV